MRKDVVVGLVVVTVIIIISLMLLINKPSLPVSGDDGGNSASIEPVRNIGNSEGTSNESSAESGGDSGSSTAVSIPSYERVIVISEFVFSPKKIFVPKGTRITWKNTDSVSHTVNSDDSDILLSGTIGRGESYSHTFNDTGTYSYHCQFHQSMKGTVVVQ